MKKIFNKKNILIFIISIIVIIIISFFLINRGRIYTKGIKVYYRTYTKEKGWSKWSKNGQVSGDKKHNIIATQMKVKSKSHGYIFYNVYSDDWQMNNCYDEIICGDLKSKKTIKKVKVTLSDTLYKRFKTTYRIYDKKWSNYSSDFEESGEKSNIKAIQIKVVDREGE